MRTTYALMTNPVHALVSSERGETQPLTATASAPRARRGAGPLIAATLGAVIAAAIVLAPSVARADEYSAEEPPSSGPQRTFGFGTAMGGGVAGVTSGHKGATPTLLLPTIEFQGFLSDGASIEVVVPLANMLLVSNDIQGVVLSTDFMYNASLGEGGTRFVVGAGLGFTSLWAHSTSLFAGRIPMEVGAEFLLQKRGFGFKLMARPWLEVDVLRTETAVGGGFMAAIGFSGYITKSH